MKSRVLLLLVGTMLLVGCRLHRPDGVLSPHRMENFLYDFHKAQAMSNELSVSERYKRELMYNYVYDKNQVSKEEVEASLVWYTRNPKELSKIYGKISARIDKDREITSNQLEKIEKKSYSVISGDTVDLWYLRPVQLLTASKKYDKVLFDIPADTSFYGSDIIRWKFNCTLMGHYADSVAPTVYLSLSLVYNGDSVSTVDMLSHSSVIDSLEIRADKSLALSRVRGMMCYSDSTGNDSLTLLVGGLSLVRTHQVGGQSTGSHSGLKLEAVDDPLKP